MYGLRSNKLEYLPLGGDLIDYLELSKIRDNKRNELGIQKMNFYLSTQAK